MQAQCSLIDAMPNAVILLDGDGRVEHCNANAQQLLADNITGRSWRDCVNDYFAPQADDWHEVSLHNGRRVKVDVSGLQDQPGQLIVLTDLTETRQLQQQLSHLQRLSAMGRMVASLAHQIRTPLSAAILYAQNLDNPKLDPPRKQRFADKLMSRLKSLELQVNDMLLFAKSGDKQVLETLSSEQLMQSVAASVQPYAEAKSVQLVMIGGDGSVSLRANLTALSGAIQNLVTNAVDASDAGQTVTVELSCTRAMWQCSVHDQGQGVPDELRERLLNPFITSKPNGTGLGLAVVQTVMKAHQGQLHWQSEQGKGSCFSVTLPILEHQMTAKEVCYG